MRFATISRIWWTMSILCSVGRASVTKYELDEYDSVAHENSTIVAGNARFTILTSRLIRMEYAENGRFEDRPSIAVLHRATPTPKFDVSRSNGDGVSIKTEHVQIDYTGGSFSSTSLKVSPMDSKSTAFEGWIYGQNSSNDKDNLRGTYRTLDGTKNVSLDCNTNGKLPLHCTFGLLSRSGFALINDTASPMLDDDDWWTDESGTMLRNSDVVDVYLLAHGHDYVGALADYMTIGGRQPLIPRSNLGVWYTRWYDLSARDVRKTVQDFSSRSMPLDIFILDMNWHKKNDWSGYSWDRNLFPNPKDTMEWLHRKGIRVGANLHDATGIGNWEDRFDDVCERLGIDPKSVSKSIPFDLTNKSYVYALEDIVLKDIEDDGMDFWWIDWQQGETAGNTGQSGRPDVPMNPTIWTDKMRVTDSIRRCRIQDLTRSHNDCVDANTSRGVVFARWGGLGNHRYQHGFSGDVDGLTWANLAFQPYFSATASNVGFGFWSHDLEGPGNDHEMYTRWLQIGAFSGILRMHDRGMSAGDCMGWPTSVEACPTVQPYNVPRLFFEANRDALRTRSELLPYIYTAARDAHDTGVGLTRPMYYAYPEVDGAYPSDMDSELGQNPSTRQFMFGPDMLVAPVTGPSTCNVARGANTVLEEPCSLTNQTVWLPPGQWFEERSGRMRTGDASFRKGFMLDEIPVFVKSGAVIARAPLDDNDSASLLGRASRQYDSLEFSIYPGNETSGSTRVYEDDGSTYAYRQGSFAWTTLNYTRTISSDTVLTEVTISSTANRHPEMPASRRYRIRLPSSMPPTKVSDASGEIRFDRWGGDRSWSFDGDRVAVIVDLGTVKTTEKIVVNVEQPNVGGVLDGLRGLIDKAVWSKRNTDETRSTMGAHSPDPNGAPLVVAAATSDALSLAAGASSLSDFTSAVKAVPKLVDSAIDELRGALKGDGSDGDERLLYSIELLESARD